MELLTTLDSYKVEEYDPDLNGWFVKSNYYGCFFGHYDRPRFPQTSLGSSILGPSTPIAGVAHSIAIPHQPVALPIDPTFDLGLSGTISQFESVSTLCMRNRVLIIGTSDFENDELHHHLSSHGNIILTIYIFEDSPLIGQQLFVKFNLAVYRRNSIQVFIWMDHLETFEITGTQTYGVIIPEIEMMERYVIGLRPVKPTELYINSIKIYKL